MALLPSKPPVERGDVAPAVMNLDEDIDQVFDVLRSNTARSILACLYDEPGVVSGLADRVDTSPQNVHYHLANLREADLVKVVGTWYSEKGTEMKVYAPTNDPLMLVIGDGEEAAERAVAELD